MTQTLDRPQTTAPKRLPVEVPPEIRQGVDWLDANFPNWEYYIVLEKLNLFSNYYCVVAQAAAANAESVFGVFGLSRVQVYQYGFTARDGNYTRLTETWKTYIKARVAFSG